MEVFPADFNRDDFIVNFGNLLLSQQPAKFSKAEIDTSKGKATESIPTIEIDTIKLP